MVAMVSSYVPKVLIKYRQKALGNKQEVLAVDILIGSSLQEHGQPDLCQHVAAVVAGRAVDPQAHVNAAIEQVPDGRNPRGQAHVRRRAVGQTDAIVCKLLRLCLVQHAAVCEPNIILVPPNLPARDLEFRIPNEAIIPPCRDLSERGGDRSMTEFPFPSRL